MLTNKEAEDPYTRAGAPMRNKKTKAIDQAALLEYLALYEPAFAASAAGVALVQLAVDCTTSRAGPHTVHCALPTPCTSPRCT